jgi:hypothetical protein
MDTNSFGKSFKHEFIGKEAGWTKCTKLVHLRIGHLSEVSAIIFTHTKRTSNIAFYFFSNFSFVNLQPTFTSTSLDWNLFKNTFACKCGFGLATTYSLWLNTSVFLFYIYSNFWINLCKDILGQKTNL